MSMDTGFGTTPPLDKSEPGYESTYIAWALYVLHLAYTFNSSLLLCLRGIATLYEEVLVSHGSETAIVD